MNAKAIIYARVSSTGERQSTARQVADLKRYAEASGMEVVAIYEEKASGRAAGRLQGVPAGRSDIFKPVQHLRRFKCAQGY